MKMEELYAIMLANGVRAQQLAGKIGVSQPTVYRWYTGDVSIPTIAAKVIDYAYGNGLSGSAFDSAKRKIRVKWIDFIDNLDNQQLIDIASGGMVVILDDWDFYVQEVDLNARYIIVWEGDTCGCYVPINDEVQILAHRLGLWPLGQLEEVDPEKKEEQDALIKIAGHAHRDAMRRDDIIPDLIDQIAIYNEDLNSKESQ